MPATKVAGTDEPGRLALCKYILRPPLANDRLKILDDQVVRLDFKKPWADGTSSVELAPLALIARLAALVPPPRRHLPGYFGVLSSHSSHRSQCVPAHGLVAKLPHSRRWRVSLDGRRTMATAIKLREVAYPSLFAGAA